MKKLILLTFFILPLLAEPPRRINRLIETVQQGKPVFGIWCSDHSMRNASALADSPLDFVIIDMEHS
ncbi:hypothetical protein MYX64_13650, partial [Nitrospinae bacterium AH_259_B05_G02_I21]|nr:hypothetical protein [Nitrospinae bacterium AH_259_B05_G02_I21]